MRIVCDFFRLGVMNEFDALAEFLRHVEGQIQESHHLERSRLAVEYERAPSGDDESVQQWLAERQGILDGCDRRFRVQHRRVFRYSFIVMLYSLIESDLSRVTAEMVKRKSLGLKLEDLTPTDLVERFKKFWTKVAGLQWWNDERWDMAKDVEQIRNCIAHRYGRTRENEKRIPNLISSGSGVRIVTSDDPLCDPDDVGMLEIDHGYCERAVAEMRGLITVIFDRAQCFGPDHIRVEN